LLLVLAVYGVLALALLVSPGIEAEDASSSSVGKILGAAAYLTLICAGAFAVHRPRRPLAHLVAVALLWDAANWANAGGIATWLRLVALTAPLLLPAALLDLAIRWSSPAGARHRWVLLTLYGAGTLAAVGHLLVYDPFDDARCRLTCTPVGLPGAAAPTATHLASVGGNLTLLAMALIAASVLAAAAANEGPGRWAVSGGVLAATALCEVTTAAAAAVAIGLPLDADGWWRAVFLSRATALLVLGLALVLSGAQAARATAAVARLGEGLSEPTRVESTLRRALRDPTLRVDYWYPDEQRWVDARGTRVEIDTPESRVTSLTREGAVVARLVHGSSGSLFPDLGQRLSAATLLAVDNARLAVVAQTRLSDIRLSRQRIVARGDAERRGLERDLHDGAQQQLVSVALFLRMAGDRAGKDSSAALRRVQLQAQEIVGELRDIAHGVFPAVLAEEGIQAAVLALVESTTVPVALGHVVERRYDAAVEMAAYSVVEETLVAASNSANVVQVVIDDRDRGLHIILDCQGATSYPELRQALTDVEDRVGALGGSLTIVAGLAGGAHVDAVVPFGG
jgi:signal transduction histidine kinase